MKKTPVVIFFEKLSEQVELPARQTEHAAGYDVRAFLPESITMQPHEIKAIPTGLRLAIPEGYHVSVRPRSGLALKHGITLINSPGTIDSDYRGELNILMINLGQQEFTIKNGERIAQLLLEKTYSIEWQTGELNNTTRAGGGFGSTGIS